jgi:hypothetical protein
MAEPVIFIKEKISAVVFLGLSLIDPQLLHQFLIASANMHSLLHTDTHIVPTHSQDMIQTPGENIFLT